MAEPLEHQALLQSLSFQEGAQGGQPARLNPIPTELTFDQGQFLVIRGIQELRRRNPAAPVLVGVGGPSGSGKSSLAGRVASVLEGAIIEQSNYTDPRLVKDDIYDIQALDMGLLQRHLQDLAQGKEVQMPLFNSIDKARSGCKLLQVPPSGLIILKGVFALHKNLQPLLSVRVAVVGGVHYNLLQKVKADVQSSGVSITVAQVMDNVFPAFRTHIEPTLSSAQIKVSNCFVADSLRHPLYVLKCAAKPSKDSVIKALRPTSCTAKTLEYVDIYLSPPNSPPEERRTGQWIRVRQCGIRYFLSVGDQRQVHRHFIIRPGTEFEVGKTTLEGLLRCSYTVAASFSRTTTLVEQQGAQGRLIVSLDRLKMNGGKSEEYVQIKSTDRDIVEQTAAQLSLKGPWITKSYVEIVLERVGVPRVASPPLASSWLRFSSSDFTAPSPSAPSPIPSPPSSSPARSSAWDTLFQFASPTRVRTQPEAQGKPGARTEPQGSTQVAARTEQKGKAEEDSSSGKGRAGGGQEGALEEGAGAEEGRGHTDEQEAAARGRGGGEEEGRGRGEEDKEGGGRGEEEEERWTRSPTHRQQAEADMAPASWRLMGLDEHMLMRTQFIQQQIGSSADETGPAEGSEERGGAESGEGTGGGGETMEGEEVDSGAKEGEVVSTVHQQGGSVESNAGLVAERRDASERQASKAALSASSSSFILSADSPLLPWLSAGTPSASQAEGQPHAAAALAAAFPAGSTPSAGGAGEHSSRAGEEGEGKAGERGEQGEGRAKGGEGQGGAGGGEGGERGSEGMAAVRYYLTPKPAQFSFDRALSLAVQAVQKLLQHNGPPIIIGIGGPSGSGKSSLARSMAGIMQCKVICLENYCRPRPTRGALQGSGVAAWPSYERFEALDIGLLVKNVSELRTRGATDAPVYDFHTQQRTGVTTHSLSGDHSVIIFEGSHTLHPSLQPLFDVRISVIGGVHSYLLSQVVRDLNHTALSPLRSRDQVEGLVFPTYQTQIKPYLSAAHLQVRNDFDPIHSRETSAFVLKSEKPVSEEGMKKILNGGAYSRKEMSFQDFYLALPISSLSRALGPPSTPSSESDWVRIRLSDHGFSVLIREPLREGPFAVQPQVDFDIGVETVQGLLSLGYHPILYLKGTSVLHQDDELLIQVDHLEQVDRRFVQIKGSSKEKVAAAGTALGLIGTYTTQPYVEIVHGERYTRGPHAVASQGPPHDVAATLQSILRQFSVSAASEQGSMQHGAGGGDGGAQVQGEEDKGAEQGTESDTDKGGSVGSEAAARGGLAVRDVETTSEQPDFGVPEVHAQQQQQQQRQGRQEAAYALVHGMEGGRERDSGWGQGPSAAADTAEMLLRRLEQIDARLQRMEKVQYLNTILMATILLFLYVYGPPKRPH